MSLDDPGLAGAERVGRESLTPQERDRRGAEVDVPIAGLSFVGHLELQDRMWIDESPLLDRSLQLDDFRLVEQSDLPMVSRPGDARCQHQGSDSKQRAPVLHELTCPECAAI